MEFESEEQVLRGCGQSQIDLERDGEVDASVFRGQARVGTVRGGDGGVDGWEDGGVGERGG